MGKKHYLCAAYYARMRIIKKIDIFILKQFCLLFMGTFFICLFIFLMQFIWKYVDDLIGKGLSFSVLAQFFFHAAMDLVPLSLPLAILLASLITFGNMGERLELLSMKAAGIPLLRILRPVAIFVTGLAFGSFYFQNVVTPESSRQLAALLYSMKQKSPELEIPEGIFYNEIPGYNLFVEHKDLETGMLYGIMIYTQGTSFDDTQVVLADSGHIRSTADQMHLQLTLYDGQRFRNMQNTGSAMDRSTVPYMRETFKKEVDLIPFDNNFSVMDANLFNDNAGTKDIFALTRGIDSIQNYLDSTGHAQYEQYRYTFLENTRLEGNRDSARMKEAVETTPVNYDTLYTALPDGDRARVLRLASERGHSGIVQTEMLKEMSFYVNRSLRIHYLERNKKFTLSLACLIFFFIGAPLGAIIRKGGLGVPVVVSVIIFIFYYMVNVSGEKLSKSGEWDVTFGSWLSTMVLTPIGVWLTYKANQDSAVFNAEGYQRFFRRLFGLRIRRVINRKEIIMNEVNPERVIPALQQIVADCNNYEQSRRLWQMPNYLRVFFRYEPDTQVISISERLETIVEEVANSRDSRIISSLNEVPILVPDAHTRPFRQPRLNMVVGVLLPIGFIMWFRIWRYRLRLWRDMEQLKKQCNYIIKRLEASSPSPATA